MDDPTTWLPETESPAAIAVLFGASVIEYVFPPFPGDTVTLLGAFLVTARQWSIVAVFLATTAGSVAGAQLDWYIGQRLAARRKPDDKEHRVLDGLIERFRRHGPVYVVINRFLPGIRGLFLVAAGAAGMPARPVLFYAAVSAALWNAVLIGVGMTVGASWETLLALFQTYTQVAWALIGAVTLAVAVTYAVRRWRHG